MRRLLINFDVISQGVTYFIPQYSDMPWHISTTKASKETGQNVHFHNTKISFSPKYSQKVPFICDGSHIYIYPTVGTKLFLIKLITPI